VILSPGATLGRFKVGERLGAGGMGEVWSARDETLGRSVALKILPEAFAADPERLSRFEREARLLAALNHPNVATLFGLERIADRGVLVLEKVSGQTLEERVAESPIPVREALPLFAQIAAALEAAHEAGIVHRDLKPANIKVTPEGRVKVLDFGLAKLLGEGPALSSDSLSPTMTRGETGAGVVLGTVAYMSPEQARGRPVDKRTDIWAFGCTLFEALSGRAAFRGETPSDTLARVIEREPDWSALPREMPPLVGRLLRRCLRKETSERLRDIGDARIQLEEAISEGSSTGSAATAPEERGPGAGGVSRRRTLGGAVLGFALGAAAVSIAWYAMSVRRVGTERPPIPPARFTLRLPEGLGLAVYNSSSLAFSPDGTRLAFAARGARDSGVWIRPLDALESRKIPGTELARSPFFLPGSDWLVFEANLRLKRVLLSGGTPQVLQEMPYPTGATAGPQGSIVLVPNFTGGLFQLSPGRGTPRRLTSPGATDGGGGHIWPAALPNERGFLFTSWNEGKSYDQADISVYEFRTGTSRVVLEGGYHARFAPSGHILFVRGLSLHSAPFDLATLAVTGPSVPIIEGVLSDASQGASLFDVSSRGSLAYVSGGAYTAARRLVSVDRTGAARTISAGRPYVSPRVSSDGRRIALWIEESEASLYVLDPARVTLSRTVFSSDDHSPAWSPDGTRLAFESGREGAHQVYVGPADGSGAANRITSGEHHHYLTDWSRDGRWLAYVEFHPTTGADLWVVSADGKSPPSPLLRTSFSEKAAVFSPDSRWLAYASDESGRYEVYALPFPGPGGRIQLSNAGGEEPAWSRDGRELYYREDHRMMAVPVRPDADLSPGRPFALFSGSYLQNIAPNRSYDVGPDGRFWMVTEPVGGELPQEIHVILGFAEELKRRVPAGTR
jgi:serine/threonine-protein kinase